MKKKFLFVIITVTQIFGVNAQGNTASDSGLLLILNQQIDNYVVQRNTDARDKLYADDFVISHGSGRVEGKAGWSISVAKGGFVMRQHHAVTVEMHPGTAILRGKLSVDKKTDKENSRYRLKYIRVYAKRDVQWQMISHVTFWEYHEPGK